MSDEIEPEQKKQILKQDYDIATTMELEETLESIKPIYDELVAAFTK